MLWISTEQKMQTQKNRNMCGFFNIDQVGALREIRTPDPLVRSQVLYPAELWAHYLCANSGDTLHTVYLLVRPERFELPTP